MLITDAKIVMVRQGDVKENYWRDRVQEGLPEASRNLSGALDSAVSTTVDCRSSREEKQAVYPSSFLPTDNGSSYPEFS